ncbi:MAG TPA: NHLP bacteriocin export ABC transporter permease/ATPase subunit [Methylomusa anaerophila]|uniref:Alpha-hemolysin translocation ATP-binding protein HlyB n=1 Tax=Methylomusa anaerophila TaxID=1930071 RepID=A0A348AHU9_9FIRM|nr:NHLP bacteriocin export ABC transporter permease/ATPase subunit [Methylomusa anaerophila]BBB90647.1 alpha-hemolysin translocation ATP-binding protein HlyB [Methylomusa anaerophila]HML88745.1 NHLP bacteriocin export ABC transporter permease/ATPase subunit [Methylomusa anaerophila]
MGADMTGNRQLILSNSQVAWLDDQDKVWRVDEGTVDIYAVTAAESHHYRQLFLAQAGEGRLLFGLSPETAGGIRLMAIAVKAAKLCAMPRADLLQTAREAGECKPEEILPAIEAWLEALLAGPEPPAGPTAFSLLSPGETLSLPAGQAVRTGRDITWARAVSGEISLGARPEDGLAPDMAIPLVKETWLVANSEAVIQGLTTADIFVPAQMENPQRFWQPLDRCQQLFATLMAGWFTGEDRRDGERLAARGRLKEQLLYGAANHLLRTDMPDLPPAAVPDGPYSPLLMVVRAAAGHLGIAERQVRLPAGADPLRQDPALLRSVARLAGIQVRQVCLEPGWQQRDNGPLIAFRGPDRHLVTLLPVSPRKYRLFDPGQAEMVMIEDGTGLGIEPLAYILYAGLPGRARSLPDLLNFMLGKCWSGDGWSIVLISMLAGLIPVLTPFITQTIFEHIIPINDRQGLVMVVQVMLVAAFATAGVSFARSVAFLRLKSRSQLVAEAALWLRLLALPAGFFRRYEAGDLAQRMHSVTQIFTLLSNSTVSALFNALFSFWSLLAMLYYSWKLTFMAGAVWIGYLGVAIFLQWRMVAAKRRMMEAMGETAGQVLQIFNGLSKFRIQGAEAQAFYLWSRKFGEQWKWNREFRWKANWLELVNTLQPLLLTMLIFWLTMDWLEQGAGTQTPFITLPQFMAFNAALTGFSATITGLMVLSVNLLEIVPQLERLRPILEAEPEVTEDKAEVGALSGRVEISNVSFRYGPDLPPILRNVSMNIRPGQFAAIVGSSGSGKSTLLRLLLGFEKPETGSIYYDGQELAEVNITSVRTQMGVVLQNGQLMAGDILTNIIGSLPLTIDDAWEAAEMVGLAEDIRAMPMGMHTLISEGASNISGGQRQRILIARSVVHRPRIIVFDEATSALDNKTQRMVTESLDRMHATRIVVAHRLSTVMNADVIYVLDKGEIVESGTYAELMAEKGLFATLAYRQMA